MVRNSSRWFSRKAQSAAAAAFFLVFVMILMIGYVIVVEPDERAVLLGEDFDSDSSVSDAGEINGEILLEETPGRIKYLSQDEVEHTMASIHVFASEESTLLAQKDSIYLKNSMFSEEEGSFSLVLEDYELTSDVKLSFRVADISGGRLRVVFNGETLVNDDSFSGQNVDLEIPSTLLSEQNDIRFSVSAPGAVFWRSHEASLENVKFVGDVKNLESTRASASFQISDTEYDNLESVEFSFQPDCAPSEDGRLQAWVNGQEVYAATPDCDVQMSPIELGKDLVQVGQNSVEFYTEEGDYTIYNIKVISELEKIEYPTYYFKLTLEEFDDVEDGKDIVELTLDFVEEGNSKRGYVSINGYKRSFDTTSASFAFDISDYVETGNNAIKIIPSKTIEVRELTVEMG